ncbi:hypothetical protein [Xanthomonas sp. 1678]|uniref:hypothetical protein n=1 Tax=Xanthomonas sp. 1678 TaxID=3158788 RepID=UPI002854892B|nr:hypothetical protein [Xanthomonas translucens]
MAAADPMRPLQRMSIALALTSLLCACGLAPPPSAGSRTDPPQVWTGLSCTSATREKDRILVSSTRHGPKTTCVDRGAAHIDYRKDALRIVPDAVGVTALELRCTSPQQASAFFQSEQDQLAILVAGDDAIALYRVGPPTMGCGWHSASDLQQTIAQCAIIAEAWSVPGERCSTLCDQDNADTNGICIATRALPEGHQGTALPPAASDHLQIRASHHQPLYDVSSNCTCTPA